MQIANHSGLSISLGIFLFVFFFFRRFRGIVVKLALEQAAVGDDGLLPQRGRVARDVHVADTTDLDQVLQSLGHLKSNYAKHLTLREKDTATFRILHLSEDEGVLVVLVVDVADPDDELRAHLAAAVGRALLAAHAHRALFVLERAQLGQEVLLALERRVAAGAVLKLFLHYVNNKLRSGNART